MCLMLGAAAGALAGWFLHRALLAHSGMSTGVVGERMDLKFLPIGATARVGGGGGRLSGAAA